MDYASVPTLTGDDFRRLATVQSSSSAIIVGQPHWLLSSGTPVEEES
jgi:hypothetical protein